MIKKPFIGFAAPRLEYDMPDSSQPAPTPVSPERLITLFDPNPSLGNPSCLPKVGDKVRSGQKLPLYDGSDAYMVATAAGTISNIATYPGDFGSKYLAVSVTIEEGGEADDCFKEFAGDPSPVSASRFLKDLPGAPPMALLSDRTRPINRVIINCMDRDVLVSTNQHVAMNAIDDLTAGIDVVRKIARTQKVSIAASAELAPQLEGKGADIFVIDNAYPSACPELMIKSIYGEVVPAGMEAADLGIAIFSAEAVVSLARAYASGTLPVNKTLTLIKKDGTKQLVEAPVGTPVSDILNAAAVTLSEKDQVVIGGPMTGSAVYSAEYPVRPDTDAVLVLDREDVALASDYPCINCGDCIRVCPGGLSINVLVRFLEVGHYDEAADNYDLFSCIECGVCSFVCPVKIPIFQYIRLAKYEIGRLQTAEA